MNVASSKSTAPAQRRLVGVALLLTGGVYSWFAAGTHPFTASADAYTASAFGAVALVAAATRRGRLPAVAKAPPSGRVRTSPWALAVTVLVFRELVTFVAANRSGFPTASSLYDQLAAGRAVKAAVFLSWLVLGHVLFSP